ncbi:MAG: helix-turn-helix transcriptional regulator [Pseudomonadota bacterium]
MAELTDDGTDFLFDFTTIDELGAPVIVARPARRQPVLNALTPRQRTVALAAADGASNKDIATQLGITPATVKDHMHAALARLKLRSRSELAALIHGTKPSGKVAG